MANHVSALKRARQTETRTEVNRANRSRVRTSLRALREALAKGDAKAAKAQYQRHRLNARQGCAKRRSALQHRLPLQEPFERAPQGSGDRQGDSQAELILATIKFTIR